MFKETIRRRRQNGRGPAIFIFFKDFPNFTDFTRGHYIILIKHKTVYNFPPSITARSYRLKQVKQSNYRICK